MIKKEINIVWLKRDLRSQDHEPLLDTIEPKSIPPVDLVDMTETTSSDANMMAIWQENLKEQKRIRALLQDLIKVQSETLTLIQNGDQFYSISNTQPISSQDHHLRTLETQAMASLQDPHQD